MLPGSLPLLPLHGQVLLPTSFVRIQVSSKASKRCVGLKSVAGLVLRQRSW